MEDLPEEILERVIEHALPTSASIMRNGRGVGGHQSLFNVSKQFCRIARDVLYSQPLQIYISQTHVACDGRFQRSLWLKYTSPPWERFRNIQLHFHPEISFLENDRHKQHVLRQMDHSSLEWSHGGIWAEAYQLTLVMQMDGLPQLVKDRKLDVKIHFHDTCPFHERTTNTDAEHTSPYHIPLWDRAHIKKILEGFQWLIDPIESLSQLRELVTFPSIAWATRYSDFDKKQLGPDFIFHLTLLDMWAEAGEEERAIAGLADGLFSKRSRRYNSSLEGFVESFDSRRYSSYSISPGGQVHKLEPDSIRNMQYYHRDWASLMYRWKIGTYESDHEFNVVETVLMRLRDELDRIETRFHRSHDYMWRLMVLHARTEAFRKVFTAIAKVWNSWKSKQGVPTSVTDDNKSRRAVRAQLERLESLGLWDGKWEDLQNDNCYVDKADAKLERFWCKCGTEINLDVREVVKWKAKNGRGHHEPLEQRKGTQLDEDMAPELQ